MNLRKALKELEVPVDTPVFVSIYGKGPVADKPLLASELTASQLKREVLLVQPNHGGQEYGYKLLKFILK